MSSTKKVQKERKEALAKARPPQATGRYLKTPPDKARIMARNVVGMPVSRAIDILSLSPRKASGLLLKLVRGAISSAADKKNWLPDDLVISRISVDRASMLKRYHPCAHGRAKPILKRTCHITVVVDTLLDEGDDS